MRSNCTDKGYPRARLSRDIEHKINTVDISRDPREKLKRSNGGEDRLDGSRFDLDLLVGLLDVIVSFLSIFSFSENWRLLFEEKRRNILIFAVNLRGDRYNCNNIFSIRRRWRIVRVGNATGRKQYRDEQIGSLEERFRRCERVVSIGNPPEGIKRK